MTVENLLSCPNVENCYMEYYSRKLENIILCKTKKDNRITIPLNLTQANDRAPQTHRQKRVKARNSMPLQYRHRQHH
jgi:hypothetical protein